MKISSRKNKEILRHYHQALKTQNYKHNLDYGFLTYHYIEQGVAWVDIEFISKHKGRAVLVSAMLSCIYHEEFEEKYFELSKSDRPDYGSFDVKEFLNRLNNRTDEELDEDRKKMNASMEKTKEYIKSLTPGQLLDKCYIQIEESKNKIFLSATIPTKAITRKVIDSFIAIYNANLPLVNTFGKRRYRQLKGYADLHTENELDRTNCFSNALLI